jgi:hypothetical protein
MLLWIVYITYLFFELIHWYKQKRLKFIWKTLKHLDFYVVLLKYLTIVGKDVCFYYFILFYFLNKYMSYYKNNYVNLLKAYWTIKIFNMH